LGERYIDQRSTDRGRDNASSTYKNTIGLSRYGEGVWGERRTENSWVFFLRNFRNSRVETVRRRRAHNRRRCARYGHEDNRRRSANARYSDTGVSSNVDGSRSCFKPDDRSIARELNGNNEKNRTESQPKRKNTAGPRRPANVDRAIFAP